VSKARVDALEAHLVPASILPEGGWVDAALARARSAFFLKFFGIPLFIALFFAAYFWILRHPIHPPALMPVLDLDRAIGFHAQALPCYLTLWVYVSIPPCLAAGRRELYAYGVAIALMSSAALACFLLFPTAVPPGLLEARSGAGMSLVMSVDLAGNACPSMHVAAALFSGCWIERQLRTIGAPAVLRVLNLLWGVAIIYSTMATKQHVAIDVAGGLVLGAVAAWLSPRLPALASYGRSRQSTGGAA
jgi:membrane-associated phospholipid phosphatase